MKGLSTTRIALAISLIMIAISVHVLFASWLYTSLQLALARSHGVFPTPEQAMLAKIDRGYVDVSRVDIFYAGPNSFDGSQPHVWYVIAEVRAAARAGGSELGSKGCDAPGSFFLQTEKGWVHVSEGAFPEIIGFWMKVFGLAGPGRSNPSIDWAPSQPARFCQSAYSLAGADPARRAGFFFDGIGAKPVALRLPMYSDGDAEKS